MAKSNDAPDGNAAPEKEVRTLRQKMSDIRAEAFGIGKDDIKMRYRDKNGKEREAMIKGHTVEAVLAQIRPLLHEHGVGFIPNLVSANYNGNMCNVIVEYEFYSIDNESDSLKIQWGGAGTDKGDKAFSKAGTNSIKEVIKKTFLVTDRDDAKEETENVEHRAEGEASTEALNEEKEKSRAAVEQWAKAMKLTIEKADEIREIRRLKRNNKDMFDSLPDNTKEFFDDLIKKKEEELSAKSDNAGKKIEAFIESANKYLDTTPLPSSLLEWENENGDKLKYLRDKGGDKIKEIDDKINAIYDAKND